jgi:uncharacterized protein YerC
MQVSSKKLSSSALKQMYQDMAVVLADLCLQKEATQFFQDFFTETEQMVLVKRLAVILALEQGLSYLEIKKNLNISSATISSVAEKMKTPGVQVALQKLRDDAWAEKWVKRLGL